MAIHEILIWFALIFSADIGAMIAWQTWQFYKNRRLDLGCDSCDAVVALRETPDKGGTWLCPKCMNVFIEEHRSEFTDEQIRKARRGYRKIKRNRTNKK